MKPVILIPMKSPGDAKSRLDGFLPAEQRAALAWSLFRHVLETAIEAVELNSITVVSGDAEILSEAGALGAMSCLEQTGAGLNGALAAAIPQDAKAVLVLHADLPLLETDDIHAMIAAGHENAMVIAPDRRGEGTNALFLRPPGLIPFQFGEESFDAHCALAKDAGVTPHILEREGLAFDLDTREDYLELTRQVKL